MYLLLYPLYLNTENKPRIKVQTIADKRYGLYLTLHCSNIGNSLNNSKRDNLPPSHFLRLLLRVYKETVYRRVG